MLLRVSQGFTGYLLGKEPVSLIYFYQRLSTGSIHVIYCGKVLRKSSVFQVLHLYTRLRPKTIVPRLSKCTVVRERTCHGFLVDVVNVSCWNESWSDRQNIYFEKLYHCILFWNIPGILRSLKNNTSDSVVKTCSCVHWIIRSEKINQWENKLSVLLWFGLCKRTNKCKSALKSTAIDNVSLLLSINKPLNGILHTASFLIISCMDFSVAEQPVIKMHFCLSSRVSRTVLCVCIVRLTAAQQSFYSLKKH